LQAGILAQIGSGMNSHVVQFGSRYLTDTKEALYFEAGRKIIDLCRVNQFLPLGLLISEATLAMNLLTEIPALAVSPVSSNMRCRISRAMSVARLIRRLFSVTSRKASSSESGSTRSV